MDADLLLACGAKTETSSAEGHHNRKHVKSTKVRCSPCRIRDFHGQARTVTRRMSKAPMSRREFEFCRSTFKTVIQQCNDIEFGALCVILGCVLWSFEPLREVEMATVIDLLLGPLLAGDDEDQHTGVFNLTEAKLKYRSLVNVNKDGFWVFSHPSFADFLIKCPFRDIDRKGIMLAKACLIQVGRDCELQEQYSCGPPSNVSFSNYAGKFWKDHYRLVQGASSGLTARVHLLILGDSRSDTPWRLPTQSEVKQVLAICEQEDFHVLRHVYRQLWHGAQSTAPEVLETSNSTSPLDTTSFQARFRQLNLEGDDSDVDDWVVVPGAAQDRA